MPVYKTKKLQKQRRHNRLRKKVIGSAERPRLSVSFSEKHMYVQLIDDDKGCTIAATSTLDPIFKESGAKANVNGAEIIGKIVAEKAKEAGVSVVVFDRGGYRYHGRVKAIAEAARENGLKF